jgi:hypothetical protein
MTILRSPDPTPSMRTSRFIRRDDRSTVADGCGTLAESVRLRISPESGKPLHLIDGMAASARAARRRKQGELSRRLRRGGVL